MVHLNMALLLKATGSDGNSGIADAIGSIKDKLVPSWISLLIQFAALVALIMIVIFCAYKPVKKILQKRSDYIESNIREAEQSKAVAAQREQQSAEIILESKKQAALIIEDAQKTALKEKDALLNETRVEVAKMKSNAELDIERSKQEALDEIHSEMVDVALAASSEILKREVNDKDNARLTEEFIKNLD